MHHENKPRSYKTIFVFWLFFYVECISHFSCSSGLYTKMTALKIKNPHLKVLLSVGGSREPGKNFSRLSASVKKRKKFATNAVTFLKNYNFDGLDLYWFYPGGSEEDKSNFPLLLQELKKEFSKNNLLLSVILSGLKEDIDKGYDVPAIAQQVDWMNINVYYYHTPYDNKFGIHAPLDSNDEKNVKKSIDYFLNKGAPANKIILRVAANGYGFKNVDKPGNIDGITGLIADDKGFLAIFEICEYLDSGWKSIWDSASSTPIATKGNQKISYEDQQSLKMKVRYAVEKNLLGVAFTSLDIDDFKGTCSLPGSEKNNYKYPLLLAINEELGINTAKPMQNDNEDKITVFVSVFDF
ncbi:chitinase-3-like protein 1 isoform X2 [Lycorma delicatula]|uniref:chitinase-3-like protein 1 isoform X2 n=1 Tax=Lycorma delicatula TaxID=130591 RepID=UPI003F512987